MKPAALGAALSVLIAAAGMQQSATASDLAVKITPQLDGISVMHDGRAVQIQRDQDTDNEISPAFQRTSRRCPPFCIQPMQMPEGVETVGEIEMLDYLQRAAEGDRDILIIDSRGEDWLQRGTIPGSINIHYKQLSRRSSEEADIARVLERQFGAERGAQLWDFRSARTLVLFCNGPWCGQSPTNIRALLRLGYPPSKIKWYRGGMQAWETLGLTTAVPE
jgi:rhodanese-related sulfurtransferase